MFRCELKRHIPLQCTSLILALSGRRGMTMSLRDVDVIDYIGVNSLLKRVYVGIFDECDWHDEKMHEDLLTRKIDGYNRYIRSGQLLMNYPHVRGYQIVFEYVSMHKMTPSALQYWKTRERVIHAAGFDVRVRAVDVRRSLGIKVDDVAKVEAELVEPAAIEVLDADPRSRLADVTDISYLPPLMPSRAQQAQTLPAVLTRLSLRRAAMN
ncbi:MULTISPECIES: DUF6572 domain-containing protein [unclassified Caballeronia]|uniref:DUF6572 domain-containing protein n=3 Tax=Caballeronia TaxID=1827195 RepID=UPI00285D3531|nr:MULTISPECIES: DUF6572 domain-containing protein [unclassified Caballeronia]MDR5775173.1 hypothetical protein [Caballeronia sp. LZ002]MDR5800836.1 hypothetical protein [Caballeronia sp. LZ001]MDR5850611.1 hypothetical protein [Caballeronia sp. LZ003]